MAGILNSIEISARGLSVQRAKMDVVAQNMANAETTETAEGGPYRRKRIIVSEDKLSGGFDSELRKANTELLRTNESHRLGKSYKIGTASNLSTADMKEVQDPESTFKLVYDPSHPDADAEGYVKMPDVEIITEMVDMMIASRAYEANTSAIAASKKMIMDTLDI
ncbi:MAG: flagellar basal body rod protein FlgC [candidate division Zixibacteria bacterium]|nr:flagellar basal body rod protein FlgC [candidate division Zixibacteria bacterium]